MGVKDEICCELSEASHMYCTLIRQDNLLIPALLHGFICTLNDYQHLRLKLANPKVPSLSEQL